MVKVQSSADHILETTDYDRGQLLAFEEALTHCPLICALNNRGIKVPVSAPPSLQGQPL